jgi:hypothetical protein
MLESVTTDFTSKHKGREDQDDIDKLINEEIERQHKVNNFNLVN